MDDLLDKSHVVKIVPSGKPFILKATFTFFTKVTMISYLLEFNRYMAVLGVGVLIGIAYLFSSDKRCIHVRTALAALGLQFLIGYCMLKVSIGQRFVGALAAGVSKLYAAGEVGSRFVFGAFIDPTGPWQFVFAFKVLPVIIFFGGFLALLFHFGIVQLVVNGISYVLRPVLGTSGAETLCAVANSFLGQTEAPLLIRHYLAKMSKSEVFVVMVSGMATISGSILAVFSQSLNVPAEHLLAASMMSVPGSLLIAKIMIPQTDIADQHEEAEEVQQEGNMFDALAAGTINGLHLALNVAAMLIVFVALMGLADSALGWVSAVINARLGLGLPELSLSYLFGLIASPIAYLFGFTGETAFAAGSLMGTKVVINEFVAYQRLMTLQLDARSIAIITYALCGFSNFSCIGIQIGGIGALCPQKRTWLTQLGLRAVLASSLVNFMNACIASILL